MATASAMGGGDQKLSSLECAICFEKYKPGVKIPKMINCGHTFCDSCINSLIENNRLKCPKCREASFANRLPTNYDLLSMVDEEDNRAKSFKYNCTDCSIGLMLDKALKCKGDHKGFICYDCYFSKHIDHGGVEQLKFLLNKNRPTFDGNLKRLIENRERYKALEADIEHRRVSLESVINRLTSEKDYVTHILDELRTEIDEINRMCDVDSSNLLEKLIISGRVGAFTVACNFGNRWLDWHLASTLRKISALEAALSEMMKTEDDDGNRPARQNAHKFRPFLELLEGSSASGDRSGHQTQGTQSAGNNTASSGRPIRAPFMVNEFPPVPPGFFGPPPGFGDASTSGRDMSGGVDSSTTGNGERGRRGFINKTRGGGSSAD